MKKGRAVIAGLLTLGAFVGCQEEEEITSDCFPAVVIDQGCGTVLGILDTRAAEIVDDKPKNDTVYVNTFNLHPVYQKPGKRLYITMKSLSSDESPECPGFIPVVYPHIKLVSVSEVPCK